MDRIEKLAFQAFKQINMPTKRAEELKDFISDHYEEFATFQGLVATQIFKELEDWCPHYSQEFLYFQKLECDICMAELKSKHGVKE